MKLDGIAALIAFTASMLLFGKIGWLSSEGPDQLVAMLLAVAVSFATGGIVEEMRR